MMRVGVGLRAAGALLALGLATAAAAQARDGSLRPFCPDRPSLDTPPCIVDQGHVAVELGGLDWTRETDPDKRSDTFVAGDLLLRYGLTDTLELKLGWTPFGSVREQDRATGAVSHDSGTGDVSVALQQSITHPDGKGFSVAVTPFATLPSGGKAIGAGDWGAGVKIPVNYDITDKIALIATPEIDAAVDEDRHGRHLVYGSVIGVSYDFNDKLGGAIELSAMRDDDPEGHDTQSLASLSFGYQPHDGFQLDVGGVAGLNHDSPDVELYFGVSRRF